MGETRDRVPPHLRRFVVQQDYEAYTEVDHAVWRFVLVQMRDRLRHAAHPAYVRGLGGAGMSVERIPRIAEIDAALQSFGWGAVCVDGFIPPRAFQEFQARSILPIAAEIRCVENLPYTPAPDIIHEAAGHAPILADPQYAEFLRRIGDCGMRAFASRRDHELYDVIFRLSELKEQRGADPAAISAAERELARLAHSSDEASEAARLSRLYWWTVEYGLVGSLRDYKLYGAGLLSSLGESFFCHDAAVRKLPLDAGCAEVDYDITRPQPQLFVVNDFAQLHHVLDEVCAQMAFHCGGLRGVETARAAAELATIELDSGLTASGVVNDVFAEGGAPFLVALNGGCALGERHRIRETEAGLDRCEELALVLGPLASGRGFSSFVPATGGARALRVSLANGVRLEGRFEQALHSGSGELSCVTLRDARVLRGDEVLWHEPSGRLALATGRITSVAAGVRDSAFWPATAFPATTTPGRSRETSHARARRELYERVAAARIRADHVALVSVHDTLQRDHPDEWLLRFDVLECLERAGVEPERRATLVNELFALEQRLLGKYPIAMGLRFLGYEEEHSALRASAPPR